MANRHKLTISELNDSNLSEAILFERIEALESDYEINHQYDPELDFLLKYWEENYGEDEEWE